MALSPLTFSSTVAVSLPNAEPAVIFVGGTPLCCSATAIARCSTVPTPPSVQRARVTASWSRRSWSIVSGGSFVLGMASFASEVAAVAQSPDLTASSKVFSSGLTTDCGTEMGELSAGAGAVARDRVRWVCGAGSGSAA